jgi:hypothetical protein
MLSTDCIYSPVSELAYYNCAGTWVSPYYGANGIYDLEEEDASPGEVAQIAGTRGSPQRAHLDEGSN